VLHILSLGGKGEVAKGETNRVKVVLNPLGVGGRPPAGFLTTSYSAPDNFE
jgi:hypothetical protein